MRKRQAKRFQGYLVGQWGFPQGDSLQRFINPSSPGFQ